jgi:hypothetical protein
LAGMARCLARSTEFTRFTSIRSGICTSPRSRTTDRRSSGRSPTPIKPAGRTDGRCEPAAHTEVSRRRRHFTANGISGLRLCIPDAHLDPRQTIVHRPTASGRGTPLTRAPGRQLRPSVASANARFNKSATSRVGACVVRQLRSSCSGLNCRSTADRRGDSKGVQLANHRERDVNRIHQGGPSSLSTSGYTRLASS